VEEFAVGVLLVGALVAQLTVPATPASIVAAALSTITIGTPFETVVV